jgi:hypothetical protein
MTWEERVTGVQAKGFTDRQAGFLVTVMLHSGVCLLRQYSTYARIAHGRKVIDFFEGLVARGYATARPCGHHRARLYHLHSKPLYRAIGEPNNRHRRPTAIPRAIERLMLLDAVLADRERTWLATERDKLAYFTLTRRVPRQDLPSLTFRAEDAETVRYFPDKLPIGLDADGRMHIFLYVLTQDVPIDFRAFLERHAELFRALPEWTVRLLVPLHKSGLIRLYQAAFHEHLASPLRPSVLEDLRWCFHSRRAPPEGPDERFDQAVRAFGAPRFQSLYRAWRERGEPVLDATLSTTLADAIRRQTGRLECTVLPHRYAHLLPLVGTA